MNKARIQIIGQKVLTGKYKNQHNSNTKWIKQPLNANFPFYFILTDKNIFKKILWGDTNFKLCKQVMIFKLKYNIIQAGQIKSGTLNT